MCTICIVYIIYLHEKAPPLFTSWQNFPLMFDSLYRSIFSKTNAFKQFDLFRFKTMFIPIAEFLPFHPLANQPTIKFWEFLKEERVRY